MTAPALICRNSFFTSNLTLSEEDPQIELLRGFPVPGKAPCVLSCSLLLLPVQFIGNKMLYESGKYVKVPWFLTDPCKQLAAKSLAKFADYEANTSQPGTAASLFSVWAEEQSCLLVYTKLSPTAAQFSSNVCVANQTWPTCITSVQLMAVFLEGIHSEERPKIKACKQAPRQAAQWPKEWSSNFTHWALLFSSHPSGNKMGLPAL